MKKECVLIIGGGLLQVPAIKIAKEKGLIVAATDINPEAPGIKIADVPKIIDIYDVRAHLELVNELKKKYLLKGVFTEGADAEVTVAEVAWYAHLPGISPQAAKNCKNKVLMRKCFEKTDIQNPKWKEVKTLEEAQEAVDYISLPLIIKAVDNCASRGSTKIYKKDEMPLALERAIANSTTRTALFEELFKGREQSTEIIFDRNGECRWLNIVDRSFTKGKWALELGHINPSTLPQNKKEILFKLAEEAAKACGVNFGAFKIDTIWTKNGPRIMECTARLSGGFDCQYTTPLATGRNFIKAALDLSLGNDMDSEDLRIKWKKFAVCWCAFPKPGKIVSIAGMKRVFSLPGVKHIFLRAKVSDVIPEYSHCAERPAFVIAVGKTKKQTLQRAKLAVKALKISTIKN